MLKVKGREVLTRMLEMLDEDQLEKVMDEYEHLKKGISEAPACAGRAGRIMMMIEKHRGTKSDQGVSCQAGCAACCHWKVSMNHEEADLIMEYVKHRKIEIDKIRLKIQKDFSVRDFWAADEPVSRCVFLGAGNRCSVYEVRPMVCRNHKVTSPAENCKITGEETSVKFQVVADLYPELIAAAYDEVVGTKGYLADLILERIEANDG